MKSLIRVRSVKYSIWFLFFTSILLFLSDFPPATSLGFITGATDNHSPETLLAVPDAFPAGVVVSDPPSFVEKKGQFLFPFLAHSRHRHSSSLPSCQCPVSGTGQRNMVTFRYHFLHFLPFTTDFFDLKYICLGFILSDGRKRCLVVFRYHFGTIHLDYFNCPGNPVQNLLPSSTLLP